MNRFPRELQVEMVNRKTWKLISDFEYISKENGKIIVPYSFEMDFASVPRWPLTYLLLGDYGHQAAVIHDWVYASKIFDRKTADNIFKDALRSSGIARWRAWIMWAGVRVGGSNRYKKASINTNKN